MHYAGIVLVLALIVIIGAMSGRNIKSAKNFAGGGNAGYSIVVGTVIGTLVGGSSTIGTAQLAFSYGFSAWWFTVGGGLGCLIMALFYTKPLYESGAMTLPEILKVEYGQSVALAATTVSSLGSFLSVISQILSGVALVSTIFVMPSVLCALCILLLMFLTVIFGGVWGTGRVGTVKTILLSATIFLCGTIALAQQGGVSGFYSVLDKKLYFNLFARGVAKDLGNGLSLIVGVLTTQAYFQAIRSARNLKVAKTSILISAVIIPLIGLLGVFVGMYMKINYPNINSATALPRFILMKLPAFPAGIALGTLLLAVIATGSGIALGVGTMLKVNIYDRMVENKTEHQQLIATRVLIGTVLGVAGIVAIVCPQSLIMNWSFLSMGLRGAGVFLPLTAALFLKGRASSWGALLSIVVGPLFTVLGKAVGLTAVAPLFIGILASLLVLLLSVKID